MTLSTAINILLTAVAVAWVLARQIRLARVKLLAVSAAVSAGPGVWRARCRPRPPRGLEPGGDPGHAGTELSFAAQNAVSAARMSAAPSASGSQPAEPAAGRHKRIQARRLERQERRAANGWA